MRLDAVFRASTVIAQIHCTNSYAIELCIRLDLYQLRNYHT